MLPFGSKLMADSPFRRTLKRRTIHLASATPPGGGDESVQGHNISPLTGTWQGMGGMDPKFPKESPLGHSFPHSISYQSVDAETKPHQTAPKPLLPVRVKAEAPRALRPVAGKPPQQSAPRTPAGGSGYRRKSNPRGDRGSSKDLEE